MTTRLALESVPNSESGGIGSVLWLMLGIGIGIIIGFLIAKAFGKPQSKADERQSASLDINTQPRTMAGGRSAPSLAKRCPVCNSTYTDEALIYCVSDGATLVSVKGASVDDPGATMLNRDLPPTEAYRPNEPIK